MVGLDPTIQDQERRVAAPPRGGWMAGSGPAMTL